MGQPVTRRTWERTGGSAHSGQFQNKNTGCKNIYQGWSKKIEKTYSSPSTFPPPFRKQANTPHTVTHTNRFIVIRISQQVFLIEVSWINLKKTYVSLNKKLIM